MFFEGPLWRRNQVHGRPPVPGGVVARFLAKTKNIFWENIFPKKNFSKKYFWGKNIFEKKNFFPCPPPPSFLRELLKNVILYPILVGEVRVK